MMQVWGFRKGEDAAAVSTKQEAVLMQESETEIRGEEALEQNKVRKSGHRSGET